MNRISVSAQFVGGFELALSCDLIVAVQSGRFVFPEARLGIMTLQAGVIRLAQLAVRRTQAPSIRLETFG
ncbi:enoyl-CoA hydratase-related protein [Bradyrhizobium genosp. P]|uniref:enoyl-CoA hydratase-related protein n=1 Tax=Bradyrhizobium genosp. P TaxID=83641 RepID=UPI003CEEFF00